MQQRRFIFSISQNQRQKFSVRIIDFLKGLYGKTPETDPSLGVYGFPSKLAQNKFFVFFGERIVFGEHRSGGVPSYVEHRSAAETAQMGRDRSAQKASNFLRKCFWMSWLSRRPQKALMPSQMARPFKSWNKCGT